MDPILEFRSVEKVFPGVRALSGISLQLGRGEVRGLVGENGAGKSTLLKLLSGAYQPTSGSIAIEGKPVEFKSTRAALDAGIAVIYQELNLVPDMTIAENLFLGHMPKRRPGVFVDSRAMDSGAKEGLELVMEDIDPLTKVRRLPIAQRQMVEIAKALLKNAKIIAFDEPTSSLSELETVNLFKIIKGLKSHGTSVIYVSHRLEEIFEVCDSVTVFRDGLCVETFADMRDVDQDKLVSRMVGRDIHNIYGYRGREVGEVAFEAKGIEGSGLSAPASFSAREGEIVGFFGLVGAGRTELMKLVYGATRKKAGTIELGGEKVRVGRPRDAIRHGIAYLPEDRKDEGIIPVRSVAENINLSCRRIHSRLGFFVRRKWEEENAAAYVGKLSIKTPSLEQAVSNLSGGNQQKVILARWLSEDTRVIIMDEPTRGIDVGTKSEIYSLMYGLAEAGKTIIFVSSDLPEVMGISDRLVVMKEGRIVAEVPRREMEKERILRLALPDAREESAQSPSNPQRAIL